MESVMTKSTKSDVAARLHEEHKLHLEELEKDLQEKKEELNQLIRKYPITSVCVAVGIGFLIGRLFSNRK
jgi:ElaB/YqjD/DUF883 family membrane-anchored ribosome-binding protein